MACMTDHDPCDFWKSVCRTVFAADSPVGKAVLDRDLRYVAINTTLAEFNGRPAEAHLGRSVRDVLPEAFPTLEPLLRCVIDEGQAQSGFEVQVEMPNLPGELAHWEASYLPIASPQGEVLGIYVQAVNLTAKLRAERALEESAKQLRRVLDSLFAFVGVLTPDGVLIEANRAPLEAAGIAAEEVLGKPFWDTYWWNYSDEMQQWLRRACEASAAGQVVREDVVVRMAGDTRMALDFMLVPMRDDHGTITHLIPSAIDISDRLATQKRIEQALRERTVLLQEVHHRVKNNLQIITSLLRLQARNVAPAAALVLQDSQDRVTAMALTHQLLYERNDFSALELGPYLRRLVVSLGEVHGQVRSRVRMQVEADDQGLSIDLQQAVPVALIVNELLTNAIKHAYPAERRGEILVRAHREGGRIQVSVCDDGIGFPAGYAFRAAGGLGFNLVRLLTEQLKGHLAWPDPGQPGSCFSLTLPTGSP